MGKYKLAGSNVYVEVKGFIVNRGGNDIISATLQPDDKLYLNVNDKLPAAKDIPDGCYITEVGMIEDELREFKVRRIGAPVPRAFAVVRDGKVELTTNLLVGEEVFLARSEPLPNNVLPPNLHFVRVRDARVQEKVEPKVKYQVYRGSLMMVTDNPQEGDLMFLESTEDLTVMYNRLEKINMYLTFHTWGEGKVVIYKIAKFHDQGIEVIPR